MSSHLGIIPNEEELTHDFSNSESPVDQDAWQSDTSNSPTPVPDPDSKRSVPSSESDRSEVNHDDEDRLRGVKDFLGLPDMVPVKARRGSKRGHSPSSSETRSDTSSSKDQVDK